MAKKTYYSCTVDYDTNCVVFDMRAFDGAHVISIGDAFLAIRRSVNMPWRTIAKCYCLRNANDAWRVAHRQSTQNKDVEAWLGKHIVYDRSAKIARFYFVGHVPGGPVEPLYKEWNIVWTKSETPTEVYTGIETTPFSSVIISDEINRPMILNIRTGNGVLIGFNESLLAGIDNTYQCLGRSYDLQNMVRKLKYIPAGPGAHALTLMLTDQADAMKSKSASFSMVATQSPQASIPEITATKKTFVVSELGKPITSVDANVVITDTDNKLLKMTLSTKGCSVSGFGSYIGVIGNNQSREFIGKPEHLTNDLKNIVVTPLNALSYVELKISDNSQHQSHILLVFTTDAEANSGSSKKTFPMTLSFVDSVQGQVNKSVSYTTFVVTPVVPTETVDLTISAEGCRIEVKDKQGGTHAASKSAGPLNISGTAEDIAALLETVAITPTVSPGGSIVFVFTESSGESITHTTTVIAS